MNDDNGYAAFTRIANDILAGVLNGAMVPPPPPREAVHDRRTTSHDPLLTPEAKREYERIRKARYRASKGSGA